MNIFLCLLGKVGDDAERAVDTSTPIPSTASIVSTHFTLADAQARIRQQVGARPGRRGALHDRPIVDIDGMEWQQYGETHWESKDGRYWSILVHKIDEQPPA